MRFIADFHIHSKYSRATSRNMDMPHIAEWAMLKGITVMGTGDFTHHLWLEEVKRNVEDMGNGLFKYSSKNKPRSDVYFILSSEISSIYSKKGKTYRIHTIVLAPSFKTVDAINDTLSRYGNIASDGRPILGLDVQELARIIFGIDERCMIIPGHIWTPWFSLFGSMSGFDKIEDCFEKQTPRIFALETGLSSDPAMNWRLSALDKFSLVSNSDSHSPSKIGRESNVFDCELTYQSMHDVLRRKDKSKFLFTIEFFPEEGKYHFDGHRACEVRFSPRQTREHNKICPRCGKALTVGVMNRVEQLADRKEGFIPPDAIPFKNLIPLDEIIAEVKGMGKDSLAVEREYRGCMAKFDTEFDILLWASEQELRKGLPQGLADAVMKVRKGEVRIQPGYDGEYGIISIFGNEKNKDPQETQLKLF
ncbi:MAG: DNA helicase UvrD [Candidatus Omnitrophota bacterium]|nr:MAG: DNA helicase UvrD [Candidatus Omnitrophota bacterium]